MKRIHVRFFDEHDREILDKARWEYWDADLEVPKDYNSVGVDTVIAEDRSGGGPEVLGSLTGTMAVVCVIDPFINTRKGTNLQVMQSVMSMDTVLSAVGQRAGAVDAYIAVPNQLTDYHEIVKRCGYHETVQHCTVFRKALVPDTMPLLGPIRDKMLADIAAKTGGQEAIPGPPPTEVAEETEIDVQSTEAA